MSAPVPPGIIQLNPAWAALTGPQQHIAERNRDAVRVTDGDTPMSALRDPRDPIAWNDLRTLIRRDEVASLMAHELTVPDDWEIIDDHVVVQFVIDPARPGPCAKASAPSGTELTQWRAADKTGTPGPAAWTDHIALRRRRTVMASAGVRLRAHGWAEVAADGDPSPRGRAGLVRLAADRAAALIKGGEQPFIVSPIDDIRLLQEFRKQGFLACATGRSVRVRPFG